MDMKKFKETALGGVLNNPVFVLVLGMCPTIGMSTNVTNALGLGLATAFVLVFSNVFISLLRRVIPDKVRLPSYIIIIATFVTLVKMFLEKFLPSLNASIGRFIPLIVVNCIILGRAEAFASKNGVGYSALDGLFMGLGFTVSITLMGIVREILGKGSLFGAELWSFKIGFFASSAGAFLTYGLFIAIFNVCYNAVDRKLKHKHAVKETNAHAEAVAEAQAEAAVTAKEAE